LILVLGDPPFARHHLDVFELSGTHQRLHITHRDRKTPRNLRFGIFPFGPRTVGLI
jgi:hypothetical protein